MSWRTCVVVKQIQSNPIYHRYEYSRYNHIVTYVYFIVNRFKEELFTVKMKQEGTSQNVDDRNVNQNVDRSTR